MSLYKILIQSIAIMVLLASMPMFGQQATTYSQAIELADKSFENKKYLDAKAYYQMALKYKSNDDYAKSKIEEIVVAMRAQMEKEDEYYEIIDLADVFYEEKAYTKAKAEYRKALKIIPNDQYALERIEDILRSEAEEKDIILSYNLAIEEGNNMLSENKFDEAIEAFREAGRLIPAREQPSELKALAESLKAETAEKMVIFKKEMEEAERYLLIKNYIVALEHFETARAMAPDNKEVNSKIKKIKPHAEKQAEYNEQIEVADELYVNKNFAEARKKYKTASKAWPENTYPPDMIARIDQMMADKLKNLDKNYAKSIKSGDSLLDLKEYTLAKGEYNLALTLKPDEKYPQNKLKEIDAYFANLQKEFEANYSGMIVAADKLFENKEFLQAKEQYEHALTVKPEDDYPQKKLVEIEQQLLLLEEQNKLDATYQELLNEADNLFANGHYDLAIKKYEEAQSVKSMESYPEERIAEIRLLLVDAEKQRITDEEYGTLILLAGRLMKEEKLDESRKSYQNALDLKPHEEFPKRQIFIIDSTQTAKIKALEIEAVYLSYIRSGDSSMSLLEYDAAIAAYEQAIITKPGGIEAEEKALTARKTKQNYERAIARQAKYDEAIKNGDLYYSEENYELAKSEYEQASEIKSEESYPKQQLIEIGILLKRLEAEKEQRYSNAIVKADNFFEQLNYGDAVIQYKVAKSIKPQEEYPKTQIELCNTFLAEELRKAKAKYDLAIADADKLYASKIFDKAIRTYKEAKILKPDETYPQEMIVKITSYIEENAIVDVVNSLVTINSGVTEKFNFEPVKVSVRKSNYVLVKARNLGENAFKIIFTYGSNKGKNGGFVVQVPAGENYNDFIIRVGNQYKWFSEDNDWISVHPENGDIEIKMVRISTSN